MQDEVQVPSAQHDWFIQSLVNVANVAPLSVEVAARDRPSFQHYGITPDWHTFREYFARLEKQGMGINLASYVGATQVRRIVIG